MNIQTVEDFSLKIKPCSDCVVILNWVFIEYCHACTQKIDRLEKRLNKGEALVPLIDGFELFEKKEPHIMSDKEVLDEALEVLKSHQESRVRFADERFYLEGLTCKDCGGLILVDACHITVSPPEGLFWYCLNCSTVDDTGKPLGDEAEEYWLGSATNDDSLKEEDKDEKLSDDSETPF